jgi:hypothetical protein
VRLPWRARLGLAWLVSTAVLFRRTFYPAELHLSLLPLSKLLVTVADLPLVGRGIGSDLFEDGRWRWLSLFLLDCIAIYWIFRGRLSCNLFHLAGKQASSLSLFRGFASFSGGDRAIHSVVRRFLFWRGRLDWRTVLCAELDLAGLLLLDGAVEFFAQGVEVEGRINGVNLV